METKKRKDWVDLFKFLSIFLIVLSHQPFERDDIGCLLYTFHVPAFFLISGYLENKTDRKAFDYIKVNFICLMIPFFIWNIISYVASSHIMHPSLTDLSSLLLGLEIFNPPSWFLPVLFVVKLVNYTFCKNKIAGLALIAAFGYVTIGDLPTAYFLDLVFLFIPFFCIGYFTKSIIDKLTQEGKGSLHWALCIVGFAVLCIVYCCTPIVHSTAVVSFKEQFWLFWVTGLIGSSALMGLSCLMSRLNSFWITQVSMGTLFIMCFHFRPSIIASTKISGFIHSDIAIACTTIVMFALFALLTPFVLRFVPILAGRKKK